MDCKISSELAVLNSSPNAEEPIGPSESHLTPLNSVPEISNSSNDADESTSLLAPILEHTPASGPGCETSTASDGVCSVNPICSDSRPESAPLLTTVDTALEPPSNSSADVDLENPDGSEATCRICLEGGEPEDELISPCRCKGTQQFVHRKCLDHWRAVKEGFAFAHCTTCKSQFHLTPNVSDDVSWRNRKFQLFVTRDLCCVFLTVQLAVMLLALCVALADSSGQLAVSYGAAGHPLLFYYCCGLLFFLVLFGTMGLYFHCCYGSYLDMGPCGGACAGNCGTELAMGAGCGELMLLAIVVFAFLGAFYGVMAGMMAWQKIWQRHYHILAKKVLAEEYLVVDLHGEYTTPHLDPIDEERLKSLGFL